MTRQEPSGPTRPITLLIVVSMLLIACNTLSTVITPTVTPPAATATLAPALTETPASTSTPAPTATVTGTPAPTDAQIRNGIQSALDVYARAYNDNDIALLLQIMDPLNTPFQRLVESHFKEYQASFIGGRIKFYFSLRSFKRREFGLVQAHIVSNVGDADWCFKLVDGKWVLAEPTPDQLGEPKIVEHEHFKFYTYAWSDEVNPTVIKLMDSAYDRVLKKLGKAPEQKANVNIKPSHSLTPFDDPRALAYYARGVRAGEPDRIEIFAPRTFGFSFYDPDIGWEAELEDVLTHEYTHMAHYRAFGNVGSMAGWMIEGLAEYVSDSPRASLVRAAVRSGNIIPIIDTVTPVYKQDLMHMDLLKQDRSLAYGFAYTLVAYIAETYGGLDAFWKLARAYDKTQDLDAALRQAFGVTFDQFDRGWRAWLKKKY